MSFDFPFIANKDVLARGRCDWPAVSLSLNEDLPGGTESGAVIPIRTEYHSSELFSLLFSLLTREEEQAACLLSVLAAEQDITQRP